MCCTEFTSCQRKEGDDRERLKTDILSLWVSFHSAFVWNLRFKAEEWRRGERKTQEDDRRWEEKTRKREEKEEERRAAFSKGKTSPDSNISEVHVQILQTDVRIKYYGYCLWLTGSYLYYLIRSLMIWLILYWSIKCRSINRISHNRCWFLLFHVVGKMTNQRTKTNFHFLSLSKDSRTVPSPLAICSEPIRTENSCMKDEGMTDG